MHNSPFCKGTEQKEVVVVVVVIFVVILWFYFLKISCNTNISALGLRVIGKRNKININLNEKGGR